MLLTPTFDIAGVQNVEPRTASPPTTASEKDPSRLNIERRSGLPPPSRQTMTAWHRRYAPATRQVKKALGRLLKARRDHPPHRLTRPCLDFATALANFRRTAARENLFPLADAAADLHLKRLYLRLGDLAESCTDGRWAETEEALRQTGLAYAQARLALDRWGLAP